MLMGWRPNGGSWLERAVRADSQVRPEIPQPRTSERECPESASIATGLPSGSDVPEAVDEREILTQLRHSRTKEFASVRSTGAPRTPNSKSAYDRLFLTRFGHRGRRRQDGVFVATTTR